MAYQSRVAVADAPPAPGQFPLVVFSHGSAGSRLQAVFLTEALASQGYVVAAPDHVGDTMLEVAAGRGASLIDLASDRSLDVTAVIDWMLCPSFPFAAHLRADQIAVVGFSFGGLTALASSVGFLRAPADPRVKVSVGISPASGALPADLVARIRVPTLLIGGSLDGAAPVTAHADKTFDQLTGAPARLKVIVRGAEHNSFTDLCEQAYLASESGVPAGARIRLEVTAQSTCLPPVIEVARAQRVARWFTVAFLGRYLRGEPGYGRYLTAAATRDLPVSVDSAP